MSEFEDGPGNVIQETLEYLSKLDLVVSGRLVAGESLMEDDEDSFDGGTRSPRSLGTRTPAVRCMGSGKTETGRASRFGWLHAELKITVLKASLPLLHGAPASARAHGRHHWERPRGPSQGPRGKASGRAEAQQATS